MNILAILCILGTAACSKILRSLTKPSPGSFRNKLMRFKSVVLYNEPLIRDADVTDKVLCRTMWEQVSLQAGYRIPLVAKIIQNCGEEQDASWIERNLEDARAYGVDEETIRRELVPFLRQVSAFLKTDGEDLIEIIPKIQMELLRDYYANLFFHLNALWNRLDEQERKEFRASVSPYFLNRIVPDASGAYLHMTLPRHVPSFANPDILGMFMDSLGSVNAFISNFTGRTPTHDEIEGPLYIDLMELFWENPELSKDMRSAIKYLVEVMRATEDIMGAETEESKPGNLNSQTHRE